MKLGGNPQVSCCSFQGLGLIFHDNRSAMVLYLSPEKYTSHQAPKSISLSSSRVPKQTVSTCSLNCPRVQPGCICALPPCFTSLLGRKSHFQGIQELGRIRSPSMPVEKSPVSLTLTQNSMFTSLPFLGLPAQHTCNCKEVSFKIRERFQAAFHWNCLLDSYKCKFLPLPPALLEESLATCFSQYPRQLLCSQKLDNHTRFRSEVSKLWAAAKCGSPPASVQSVSRMDFYIFKQLRNPKRAQYFLTCETFTGTQPSSFGRIVFGCFRLPVKESNRCDKPYGPEV